MPVSRDIWACLWKLKFMLSSIPRVHDSVGFRCSLGMWFFSQRDAEAAENDWKWELTLIQYIQDASSSDDQDSCFTVFISPYLPGVSFSLSCRNQWGSFQRQKLSRPSLVVFTPKSIPSPHNTLSPEVSKTNNSINSLEACVRVVSFISSADWDLLCRLWNMWQKSMNLCNERLYTFPTGSGCSAQSPGTPGCCLNSNHSCAQGPCQIFLLLLPSSLRAQISKHTIISTITHILSRWAAFYVYKFPCAPGPFRRTQKFPTLKSEE